VDELDVLLYAWLSERDARRAEICFNRYFQAAFPTLCRFIRSMPADSSTAQDVAQQALIKLFNHLGIERCAANIRVGQAIAELRPLDIGPLHVRRVESWRQQLTSFRDAAVGFRVPVASQESSQAWKDLRAEINGRIPALTRQGMQFMREAWGRIEPTLKELAPFAWLRASCASSSTPERSLAQERLTADAEESLDPKVERCVARFLQDGQTQGWPQIDAEAGCARVAAFLTHTSIVRTDVPSLAVPSNGLLYTIAKRQLIDRLRARRPETAEHLEQLVDSHDEGVLGELALEDRSSCESAANRGGSWTAAVQTEDAEEAQGLEARYRQFLEFLRAPLTRAEATLAAAAAKGKAKAEEARAASLRAKYERLMAVLAALRESPQPSEEDIARREGLTRNQVKYVIERIREEFNFFFPELAREAEGRRKRQGGES
jgi:hypothetical protein